MEVTVNDFMVRRNLSLQSATQHSTLPTPNGQLALEKPHAMHEGRQLLTGLLSTALQTFCGTVTIRPGARLNLVLGPNGALVLCNLRARQLWEAP